MATIKSYTDLEQSKKLAEILLHESADMWWLYVTAQGKHIAMMHEEPDPHYIARMEGYGIKDAAIRCWSLAALLGVLPYPYIEQNYKGKWICRVEHENTTYLWEDSNPVDACVAMIEKLHEQNIL